MSDQLRILDFFAQFLIRFARKHPKISIFITGVLGILMLISAFIVIRHNSNVVQAGNAKYFENLTYHKQFDLLKTTEANIRNLLNFIEHQKTQIRQAEEDLAKLKTESQNLRPIVESDRIMVENLFRYQDERAQLSVWKERGFGFLSGIVASFVAALIYEILRNLRKSKRSSKP